MPTNDDRVRDYFSEHIRDVTPRALQSVDCVVYVPACKDPEFVDVCRKTLSSNERQRVLSFAVGVDRQQFIVRRAFRKFCGLIAAGLEHPLSDIAFHETESGKPFLSSRPDINFSFATCAHGYLAAWSRSHHVGVDIENPLRAIEPVVLAEQYFTPSEASFIAQAKGVTQRVRFFTYWTLREAALKSIGEGIDFGLDAFSFSLSPVLDIDRVTPELRERGHFKPYLVQVEGAVAAVVCCELPRVKPGKAMYTTNTEQKRIKEVA